MNTEGQPPPSDVTSQLPQLINKVVSLFYQPTQGSGRMAARGAAAYALKQQQVAAKFARHQWEFAMRQAYPDNPTYGPLQPVAFYDIPVKLTTKQTKINQKLMESHPAKVTAKLLVKQQKIGAKIERFKTKHPEAAHYELAARKY